MPEITGTRGWIKLVWMLSASAAVAQPALPAGNGIWIKPSSTTIPGNEAAIISALQSRAIQHVFLWTTGYTNTQYTTFSPFIRQAHTNGLTVHALCATKATVTSGDALSTSLLSNVLQQVVIYNDNHADARFDGVQIDVEAVSGATLLSLVSAVHVPTNLVFSAAIQLNDFYPNVESAYSNLLGTTDLDLLVPMIYIMDSVYYSGGATAFSYNLSRIQTKTAQILSKLPVQGGLMIGLSAYDREFPVVKATGAIDHDYLDSYSSPDGFSQPAFSTNTASSYSVPRLFAAGKTLVSVTNRADIGASIYRFDFDTNRWLDVVEYTPLGVRRSIAAADQGGAGDARYRGTCTWLYHTVFDNYSGRREGLTADDGIHPVPQVGVQLLSFTGGVARLRVNLTNAMPSEQVLGDHASVGVHLRVENATFASASPGTFHAAEAFSNSGVVLPDLSGTTIIELRRSCFENGSCQQAQSGDIVVNALAPFTIRYRAWMTDKDSLCTDGDAPIAHVARSPDDIYYADASRFLTCATFATNFVPSTLPTGFRFDTPRLLNSGTLALDLDCSAGWAYMLQVSTDLLNWVSLSFSTATSTRLTFTNTIVPAAECRFYRALEIAPTNSPP